MATQLLTFNGTPSPVPPPHPTKPPHHILVLDDDEDIREICVEALSQHGYQVDTAADGEAGWEALQARPYDLLITDHNMPKLSGLDLVKKVRAAGMPLAVIVASGSLSPEELGRHPSIQISAALPKPFSPAELVQAVQHVLCGQDVLGLPANSPPGS
jgi:DNA-binding response OmpR family regulator